MKKLILWQIIFFVVFISPAFSDTMMGLAAHYPMNGDGTNVISAANSATVSGTEATADRNGLVDGALNFNGSDQMIAPGASSPMLQEQITLSAWVMPGSHKKQYIVSKGNEPYFSYALYLNFYNEGVFTVSVDRTPYSVKFSNYPTNNWFHIAATYDGNTIKIFFNGVLKNTIAVSGNIDFDDSDVYIGSLSMSYVDVFDGAIDDVRIYERALNEADIVELYSISENEQDNGDQNISDPDPDICSADTLQLCKNEMTCLAFGGLWQDNTCTKPVATTPPGNCSKTDPKYCINKEACREAGGIWHFGICMPDDSTLICMQNNYTYCDSKEECLKVGGMWDGSLCVENTVQEDPPEELPTYFGKLLNFQTGFANAAGGLGINISNLTFSGQKFDVTILLGLDGTWTVTDPENNSDEESGIDLATAMIDVVGDNALFIRGFDYFDATYNFKVEFNLDGSYNIRDFEWAAPVKGRIIPGVAGVLYEYGNAPDGTRKNVEQIAAMDHFLFLAVRSNSADQLIEVFDIGNPLEPVLLQTLDFGNITANQQAVYDFPKMFVFSETLIVQSGTTVKAYKMNTENRLEEITELNNDIFSYASAGTEMGSNFLSIDRGEGRTFVNFTNPTAPFILTDTSFTSGLASFDADVVGSYDGNAAVMGIDGSDVTVTVYKRHINEHMDYFWSDKISLIFNPDILDRSLRSVVIDVAESIDVDTSLNLVMDGYRQELGFNEDYSIDTLISSHHGDMDRVIDVLQRYGIDPNDPFKLAVEKIVFDSVNELFETRISQQLFSPVIFGWAEKTLGFDIREQELSEIVAGLKNLLDQDIELSGGAATYFAKKVVGPLIGNPPYINYTMDQLIDSIAGTFKEDSIGEELSLAITILTGGGLLSKLMLYTDFDENIPCLLSDNAIDLLRMLMYDHVGLNPDGLAIIEIIKLYFYFDNNPDFENYMARVNASIEDMHGKLAVSLSDTLLPIIRALDFAGDMQTSIDTFTRELPGRRVIAKAIAELVADRFEIAGVDTLRPIRSVLLDFDLFIDQVDFPDITYHLSDVGELRAAIGTLTMQPIEDQFNYTTADQFRINEIIRASAEYSDVMVEFAEKFLIDYVGKGWGCFDINASMRSVISSYIASRIDLGGSVGANVSSVYDGLFSARRSADTIIDALPIFTTYYQAKRAADGDCLAAWRVFIDIAEYAAAAVAWLDSGASITSLITSDVALEEAYNIAINYVVDTMIMEITSKILGQFMGNYSMMTSVILPEDYRFDIASYSTLNPVRVDGMIMEDRLGFVLREEFNFLTPRKLSLITLQPENPGVTKNEISLGDWMTVDYVHNIQGLVMVGGQIMENGKLEPAAMFVDAAAQFPEVTVIKNSQIASATEIKLTGGGTTLILSGPSGIFFAPVW